MYQKNQISNIELPSSKQLVTSTLIALVIAVVLLMTVILPAEYAKDPTGIGQWLGLKNMGEIKQQLAAEALRDSPKSTPNATVSSLADKSLVKELKTLPIVVKEITTTSSLERSNKQVTAKPAKVAIASRIVTLKPGEAAEIKLSMNKNTTVKYEWSVDTGHVNYDTHADNANTRYFAYHKAKAIREDKGVLTAAFNGKHGWFWRNRSQQTLTLTLQVTGDFSDIARVL
jgi:hypothetical protein